MAQQESVGSTRLRQMVSYGQKVYGLRGLLDSIEDGRQRPQRPGKVISAAVFFCGLLRVGSFNALEPRLSEKSFVRLVGGGGRGDRVCSVDTISRALRVMRMETVRAVGVRIVAQAERNKVFREGWHYAMRYVALDGWEPVCSCRRHCTHCLVRRVKVKQPDGSVVEMDQYYHRYVVAMLIDRRVDLVLDFEPLLPHDLRESATAKGEEDEGELTAAKRLLRRVKQTYGWLDVVVGDGLYANGPFLTVVKELRMGAVVIARKRGDEPLKEALVLWQGQSPHEIVVDQGAGERLELWDCPEVETLGSYKGPIRVVRAQVRHLKAEAPEPVKSWCALVVGKATKLPPAKVIAVARARWHIENTGFHQWTTCWRFTHVFVHDGYGIQALYWLFFAAFNLLTLFVYRQVRSYGRDRGKDPTRTISRLIQEMRDDLARLQSSPWDTS